MTKPLRILRKYIKSIIENVFHQILAQIADWSVPKLLLFDWLNFSLVTPILTLIWKSWKKIQNPGNHPASFLEKKSNEFFKKWFSGSNPASFMEKKFWIFGLDFFPKMALGDIPEM